MSAKTFKDYWQEQREIRENQVPGYLYMALQEIAEQAWNDGFNQGLQTVKDEQLKAQERLSKVLKQART